jgi:hypothetical protein
LYISSSSSVVGQPILAAAGVQSAKHRIQPVFGRLLIHLVLDQEILGPIANRPQATRKQMFWHSAASPQLVCMVFGGADHRVLSSTSENDRRQKAIVCPTKNMYHFKQIVE